MKRFSIIILLVVFCLVAGDVLAGTLYVNNTNLDLCDDIAPNPYYCTLDKAIEAASDSETETVEIQGGTYTENLTIDKSIIIEGKDGYGAIIDGGGSNAVINITADAVTVTLINLTIQNGNSPSQGGGILLTANSVTLTLNKNLIQNNTAEYGGGLYANSSSVITIFNSTFSNNNAEDGGSAIYSAGNLSLEHTTIVENNSNSDSDEISSGGAIYITPTGTLTIKNNIISNNTGLEGISADCAGTGAITTEGYNLISNLTNGCTITATTGDNFGTTTSPADPLLYSLADNGGDSNTYALQANSPAVDSIPEVSCALEEDQRGFDRPVNDACDMGAFESGLCGDGVVDAAETCDDGNASGGDGCNALCQIEECGNGTVDPGESCDDGNSDDSDSCLNDCSLPVCGDGTVSGTEECDDGNATNGDGCNDECVVVVCGNGTVEDTESCDDGNTTDYDGCSADCQLENCGDGVVDTGEACDDGNTAAGDGCSAICQIEECGNSTVDSGEECDDGNLTDGDGCSAECLDEIDEEETSVTDEPIGNDAEGGGCSLRAGGVVGFEGLAIFVLGLMGLVALRFGAQPSTSLRS